MMDLSGELHKKREQAAVAVELEDEQNLGFQSVSVPHQKVQRTVNQVRNFHLEEALLVLLWQDY